MFATSAIVAKLRGHIITVSGLLESTFRSITLLGEAIDKKIDIRHAKATLHSDYSRLSMNLRDLAGSVSEQILQPFIPFEWSGSLDFKFLELHDQLGPWVKLCELYVDRPVVLAAAQAGASLCTQSLIATIELKEMIAKIHMMETRFFPEFAQRIMHATSRLVDEVKRILDSI
jgi:hypothetical protein